MTSHLDNVWNLLHYTRLHILALWHQATIFMTSQPLYLTSHPLYLCHHIHSIDDITPTEFLRSHALYMTTLYPLHMTSQLLNMCHHTHSFNDITPSVCRKWHPLYVKYNMHSIPRPYFMTSHHIFYEITCTVFMTSFQRYLTLHPQYLCPHKPSKFDLWTTVYMTSHPVYIWQLIHDT